MNARFTSGKNARKYKARCRGKVVRDERGKAGGHEPPLFPLPGHILAFFSSGSHEPSLFPLPYHHIGLFRAKLPF